MRFLLAVFIMMSVVTFCRGCSAYDVSTGLKKLASSLETEVSSLELYLSPITVNVHNLYLAAVGKLECNWTECKIMVSKPLIERYVEEILLPTDEELAEYNADPTPDRDYEANLQKLKEARKQILTLEMLIKYHVISTDK